MKRYIFGLSLSLFLSIFFILPKPVLAAGIQVDGNVYIDLNKNGVKDPGESNYQGAKVTISGPETQTSTTDVNGNYILTVNSGGNYCIELTNPAGYTATVNNPICIFPLTTEVTLNFGIVYTAGTSFLDNFADIDGTLLTNHNNTWTINTGVPKIQNNTLHSEVGSAVISLPNISLTDQCASYDALFPLSGAGIYLMIRRSLDGQSMYYAFINPADNTFGLAWVNSFQQRYLANFPIIPPAEGWHNFKLCAIGASITAYLDGNILSAVTHAGFPQGSFAAVVGEGVSIDNFVYESIAANQAPIIDPISNITLNKGDTYSTSGSFTDPDSISWTGTVDYGDGTGVQPLTLNGMNFSLNHQYSNVGTYTITVTITDNQGASSSKTATVTVERQLVAINPVQIWIGSKNDESKIDLRSEVYKDDVLVTSGEQDGLKLKEGENFKKAKLITIPFGTFSPIDFPDGSKLSIKLLAKKSCVLQKKDEEDDKATLRLWYNDSQANSHFGATIGDSVSDYFLRENFVLDTLVGAGPQKEIDFKFGKKDSCSVFKSFGTWSIIP